MIGELFQFFLEFRNGCRIITGTVRRPARASGGLRLHRRDDRLVFLSYLRTDAGTAESGHSGCVTTLDNSPTARRTTC